jgi:hypothetical protein
MFGPCFRHTTFGAACARSEIASDFFQNLKAQRTTDSDDTEMIGIVLTVVCLPAENGTRSKRNFHRPESNCGVAINCACEDFIVD